MKRTQAMPGHTRLEDVSRATPPQMVENDGKPYLMVHAEGLTTGLVGRAGADLRTVITIWNEAAPDRGRPIGMAFSFTPSDDMLDLIVDSLIKLRDDARAKATEQAAAALRKASGK